MKPIGNFCILGGDIRQAYLAEALSREGYTVRVAALDQYQFCDPAIMVSAIDRAIERSEFIILPLPVTMDGVSLNAPMTVKQIMLDRDFAELLEGKTVLGGQTGLLPEPKLWENIKLRDYYKQEALIVGNAVLTAEAAISMAVKETPYSLLQSRCLVIGFGRIGKALALMLSGIGCKVSVAARNQKDFAWINAMGLGYVHTGTLKQHVSDMNIIFNTVPAPVMDEDVLKSCGENVLILDLASRPGGVDLICAEELGLKAIPALNLPGKYSPCSAAELIKHTVLGMLKEVKQCE